MRNGTFQFDQELTRMDTNENSRNGNEFWFAGVNGFAESGGRAGEPHKII
jgi:hypothetical protein